MLRANRLHLDRMFCFCACDAQIVEWGREAMPYVDADGARLYAEDSGHGNPIIFIHEFASDLRGWEAQLRHFSRGYRCIAYNARGYPPSDVPEDAVLQFGPRYPEKVGAIVAASVGSGSRPTQQDAWLRETSVLARIFINHGMVAVAERMARGPARIPLKYKDPGSWQNCIARLRQLSPRGLAHTMARCQAVRPSLYDLRDKFAEMTIPVLLAVGDEDATCLETNLMLKSVLPNAGLWICPNTGHGINLEEPTAFNAQIENFLGAVERGSWLRGYPRTKPRPIERLHRRTSTAGALSHLSQDRVDAELFRLDRK